MTDRQRFGRQQLHATPVSSDPVHNLPGDPNDRYHDATLNAQPLFRPLMLTTARFIHRTGVNHPSAGTPIRCKRLRNRHGQTHSTSHSAAWASALVSMKKQRQQKLARLYDREWQQELQAKQTRSHYDIY